jgi:hypothetical protein
MGCGIGIVHLRETIYGWNYSDQSKKEQGEKESFVRFSEQTPDITTVYRLQNDPWNGVSDRF